MSCWLQSAAAAEERVLERRAANKAINRAATVWCHPRCTSQFPREETRVTDGENQLRACARVALVSLTLSASFGLTGCTAIDDLKVSILNWFDPVNSTRKVKSRLRTRRNRV